eukprot:1794480-Pyramimonas_sp.AAC.1
MALEAPVRLPKKPQDCRRGPQDGLVGPSEDPQEISGVLVFRFPTAQDGPRGHFGSPEGGPRMPHGGAKTAQYGPKTATSRQLQIPRRQPKGEARSKRAPAARSKSAPRVPTMTSGAAQEAPETAQRGSKKRSQRA